MNSQFVFTKAFVFDKLAQEKKEFAQIFKRGWLEIEIYKPNGVDNQQPHKQDELYVIISGHASFFQAGSVAEVSTGDCLFVPAYDEHRFFNFSSDFATWVFFFSEGGETGD